MRKVDILFQESEKAFLAERARTETLDTKAEKLVGAVALIALLQLIGDSDPFPSRHKLDLVIWTVGIICLLIAIVLALFSGGVRRFKSYARGMRLVDEFRDENLGADDAKIRMSKFYLGAHDDNAIANDRKARLLMWSSVLLIGGLVLTIVGRLLTAIA